MGKFLIIDDDVAVCRFLVDYLETEGFGVDMAHDGETGLERLSPCQYDLVILDVILPLINGFEVLRRIRQNLTVPVIMLTGCHDEIDRVVGLEIGADDYVVKPFKPRELLARIRAVLRRGQRQSGEAGRDLHPSTRLVLGDIEMQLGSRLVLRSGEKINLTAVEFDILEALLRNAGRTVLRDDLKRTVLGRQPDPYDRSLDVHVSRLRKKLGHEVSGTARIQTIRNAGYLYTEPPEPFGILDKPLAGRQTSEMIG